MKTMFLHHDKQKVLLLILLISLVFIDLYSI